MDLHSKIHFVDGLLLLHASSGLPLLHVSGSGLLLPHVAGSGLLLLHVAGSGLLFLHSIEYADHVWVDSHSKMQSVDALLFQLVRTTRSAVCFEQSCVVFVAIIGRKET